MKYLLEWIEHAKPEYRKFHYTAPNDIADINKKVVDKMSDFYTKTKAGYFDTHAIGPDVTNFYSYVRNDQYDMAKKYFLSLISDMGIHDQYKLHD